MGRRLRRLPLVLLAAPLWAVWVAGLVWAAGLAGAPAGAEIYRWTDAEGNVHYGQDPSRAPAGSAAEPVGNGNGSVQRFESPTSRTTSGATRQRTRGLRPGEVLEIPVQRRGRMAIVQVRLNDRVTAPFIVDTGASDVAVPAHLAEAAGIRVGADTPRRIYTTANGMVSSPIVRLDSVEAGEVRMEGVPAHLSSELEVGLLGGSFFNNFTFQIDPTHDAIRLVPNAGVRSGMTEKQWRERFQSLRTRRQRLDRYLAENRLTDDARVATLQERRRALGAELEALEDEADAAGVPQAWR